MPGKVKIGLSILAVLGVIIAVGEWSKPRPVDALQEARQASTPAAQPSREAASIAEAPEGFDVSAVAKHLRGNKLGIVSSDLLTKKNPKGEGFFVYVPRTRFRGVKRLVLWLALDGRAYPLNGPTKDTTPNLPWPREADAQTWAKSGLNPYSASEAIDIVFGGQ